MTDGRSDLARRVDELDAVPASAPLLLHFIRIMRRITSTGDDRVAPCVAFATKADGLVWRSRLLAQLADVAPDIVAGPLRLDSQYWIGTHRPNVELTPQESSFVRVSEANTKTPSTKPFGVGFFTSTGVLGGHGMWSVYLEGWNVLRQTWAMGVTGGPVVHEITTASEWVDFVLSHPRREGELLFPDWLSVARHYDAIHMTLRAIVAIQGLSFRTEQGIVAPTYWDVESTFWLRWCFSSARLVERVEPEPNPEHAPRGPRLVPEFRPEPTVGWIGAIVGDEHEPTPPDQVGSGDGRPPRVPLH